MEPSTVTNDPDAISTASDGCLRIGLFIVLMLWIVGLLALSTPIIWLVRDVAVIEGLDWPWYVEPLIVLVQAGLVGLPAGLFALFVRGPRLRAAARAWTLTALALAAFGLTRGLPPFWHQATLLAQASIGFGGALALRLARRRNVAAKTAANSNPVLVACALTFLLAVPWLAGGAFGSPLDTLLALVAGASAGMVLSALLGDTLLPTLHAQPGAPLADSAFGGLVVGVSAMILAAGIGAGASNLLALAALSPLGGAAAALALESTRRTGLALGVLFGGATAAALALFDPNEITLLLGGADIPTVAGQAALRAFSLGLLISGLLIAFQRPLARPQLAGGALIGAALLAGLVYTFIGHPGFHGDRLFVILRNQADISAAPEIAEHNARTRYVYETLATHAAATQADLRSDLERFGIRYTSYYLLNALEVDGGPLVRAYLAGRPEVDRVLVSPRLRPLPAPPPPEPGTAAAPEAPPWNIALIGADRVWEEFGITGEGIVVGQSDSGVDVAHPDLAPGYRGGNGEHAYNWLDPWYGAQEPRDYGQHGTHTLGSAAGHNGIGVAPGATWFACANLARNLGNPARYLDCMQFMLAPHPSNGDPFTTGDPTRAAHVLNNSWGCPPLEGCDPASLLPAVQALRAAGIFVVASAGNEGAACSSVSSPPAIYAEALSVGAIDQFGTITDFSSRGPVTVDGSGRTKPDIVAPGDEVLSTTPGGTYATASGTSMAGPHVAGVVALIWSANPALIGDIAGTEALLRATAAPYTGGGGLACAGSEPGSNVYGFGVVDAYAAVQAALDLR
jgi:subtilisin family serine protease